MPTFTPRPYQSIIIERIITQPRVAIYAGMGMGKTSSTLFAIDYLQSVEGMGAALILAPLRVAASTWPQEAAKWTNLSLGVLPIVGDEKTRLRALRTPSRVYSINYENIPWLVEALDGKWPFDMIVADESTRLKSFRLGGKTVRARALAGVAFRSRRFVELTGTPAPNGLLDLWGQTWFLDRGARLGKTFSAFTAHYFRPVKVGRSPFAVRYDPMEWAQGAIEDRLADVALSLDAADWFPIKKPICAEIPVELPPDAREKYDRFQRDLFIEIEGNAIEAVNAAALSCKCLQAASGVWYYASGTFGSENENVAQVGAWLDLHDAKIDALRSIIEEAAGAPVLVAYHWKADAARILKAIPGARILDKDPKTIAAWNAGKIPVLLAHPASAGHGLNLQDGGNILVFFSLWWNLECYQQIIERIGPTRQLQAGHPRPVFIYHIIAQNTLDETVLKRMETKREIQDLLLERMKANERRTL